MLNNFYTREIDKTLYTLADIQLNNRSGYPAAGYPANFIFGPSLG